MAAASAYLQKKLLNLVLRGIPYPVPETVYLAVYTGPVNADGVGPEVEDSNYQRMPMNSETSSGILADSWTEPAYNEVFAGHYTENVDRVLFPPIDDTDITVTHYALWDAEEGGNMLFFGEFDVPKTVGYSDVVGILPQTLKFLLR